MAHELHIRESGFVEMAYAGEKPWHGLGQALNEGAPIEEWQVAAGMDWKVVQPRETLEFFRDLVASAGYRLCTAGVLKGGRKYWAQAECGMENVVVGNDVVRGKLLIATACDGSMKTIVKNVTERVVCANTLAIAAAEGGNEVRVSHRSKFDGEAVKAQLGIAVEDFETFIAKARALASARVTRGDSLNFLMPLFDITNEERKLGGRKVSGFEKTMDLFMTSGRGSQLPGVAGTAWGLINAVTEYVDHHRGNSATTRDSRLDWAWFGDGDKLKTQAFEKAVQAFA
jgi:phage/plasmid-like protein (TIGR03299 family)